MEAEDRKLLVKCLADVFGTVVDVTPEDQTTAHILLKTIDLPAPWTPTPTRAMTVWANWPSTRPEFYIDENVVGEKGEPPRSNHTKYIIGETWRGFSYSFSWVGDDPVRAVQMWLGRFTVELS